MNNKSFLCCCVGNFYCLNCLHLFLIKNKLESDYKACRNLDFGDVVMPSTNIKVLECNQHQKSDKILFIFYVDLQSLIKRTDRLKKKSKKSFATKKSEHPACENSLATIVTFNGIENKANVYRGEDCMRNVKWILKIEKG